MFKYDKLRNLFLILFLTICLLVTIGNFFNLGIFSRKKINLGLDLKGGSQLLLKIDFDYYLNEKLEENIDLLKDYFLENRIKALPKIDNNNIKIIYKNDNDIKEIKKYLKDLNKIFNVKDDKSMLILTFNNNYINDLKKQTSLKTIEIIKKRINKLKIKDILIQDEGNGNILMQISGLSDLKELKNLVGKTAKLTFHIVDEDNSDIGSNILKLNDIRNSYELSINKKPLLSGDLLTDVNITYNQGKPIINFKFNSIGSKKFAKITKENVGKMLAIVLDNKIITVPRISGEISGGVSAITGNFSNKEAEEIALLLRTGSLLAPINIVEEKTIDSKMGQDLIKKGVKSFVYGLILLILFLFIVYKANGIFLDISIFINMIILTAILSILGINLTLFGVIAILLVIGLNITTNIFIFEEIKKENKINVENVFNSIGMIESVFDNVSPIILDSNIIVTILVMLFYIFDSTAIKSFSIVLVIGIISSLLSNLIYLRKILNFSFKNKKLLIK